MSYLTQHPIGKKSTTTSAEVAQMLTRLPKRAAFVRSGEDTGVVYTEDTLPLVAPGAFQQRLAFIQDQTRQRFCRPKEVVERELLQPPTQAGRPAPPPPPSQPPENFSREEEV